MLRKSECEKWMRDLGMGPEEAEKKEAGTNGANRKAGRRGGAFGRPASWLALGLALSVLAAALPAAPVMAAEGNIQIQEDAVTLSLQETASVKVDYSSVPGGFSDLVVVVADGSIAAAALADEGNGSARLTLAGLGMGSTVVAVYRISNAAVVDYVTVRSGMAEEGGVYTQMEGSSLVTVYEDRLIYYNSIMNGRNGAAVAVSGLAVERESGLDCLKVTGQLQANDSKTPGMNTFYANFYDAAGSLIKRQAYYCRQPVSGNVLTLEWYIPEGCTSIVLE